MPYFTRQPYAAAPAAPPRPEGPDIVALAEAVLAQDMGQRAEGPFRLRAPVRPGGSGALVLSFAADPGAPVPPLTLGIGDLTGPAGRIPAACLRLDPAVLRIAPGGSADLRITVQAPLDIPPGLYTAVLSAPGPEGFTAHIEVPVSA